MRKALLFVILFVSVDTYGQSYQKLIRQNIYWEQFYYGPSLCNTLSANRVYFGGDTMVNSVSYSKIYEYPIFPLNQPVPFCPPYGVDTSQFYLNPYFALREDTAAQRVFIYSFNDMTEYLLYDFNLQQGDTFNSSYTTGGDPFIIDSVQTITTYDGVDRRIYYGNQPSTPLVKFFIEGIGSSSGMYTGLFDAIGYATGLTCVLDQNTSILPPLFPIGTSTCSQIVGIYEFGLIFNVNIKPNPSNGIVIIEHSYPKGCMFNLYEPNGKLIHSEYSDQKSVLLDLSNCCDGFYLIELKDQNQRIYVDKLVIVKN